MIQNEGGTRTSTSLLDRARAQDPLAWDRIVNCYGGMVFRWCRSAGLTSDAARDVGQEVFLAAYRNLKSFQPRHDNGSFRCWLRTITRTKFLDYVNRLPAGGHAPGGSEAHERVAQLRFPDDDQPSLQEDTRMFYLAVDEFIRSEFADNHCRAFYLVSAEDKSPTEVARELSMTRNAVYLACSRIRKRVRQEFGDMLDPTNSPIG